MAASPVAAPSNPVGAAADTDHLLRRRQSWIGGWLLGIAAMIVLMVVIGGLTRLTESGLSITEWRPLTGWLPPLSDAEWQRVFARYREIPEYRAFNEGMSLAEFKGIFWLEYVHRLWGRLIGLAFALPFAIFLVRGWIDRRLGRHLAAVFVLGGLQGGIGWWMVSSGLVDRTDVSQYRLAVHLVLALVILAYVLWTAVGLLAPTGASRGPADRRLGAWALWLLMLVFAAVAAGAFVAGVDAGLTYNTFPLMEGRLVPPGYFFEDPWWINVFENVAAIQFNHRLLATAAGIACLTFWAVVWRRGVQGRARLAAGLVGVTAAAQYVLGIATLLSVVALPLAALHQLGAALLICVTVWCARELRPDGTGS